MAHKQSLKPPSRLNSFIPGERNKQTVICSDVMPKSLSGKRSYLRISKPTCSLNRKQKKKTTMNRMNTPFWFWQRYNNKNIDTYITNTLPLYCNKHNKITDEQMEQAGLID